MKLQAQIGDDTSTVEITRDGARVFARVDDREYELEASEPEPNVYLLKHEGRVYEAFVGKGADGVSKVEINGEQIDVRLIDPKKLRGAGAAAVAADGVAEIKTAMPGKVVRVIVSAGDEVKKGDGILVVEAMKMQNELKSPKDGTVKSINAPEGKTVAAGDVLAVIE